ncbi:NAD(P)/FAD-dependent oxidoreductase [Halobacillus yeomjeoni]|uniref:dihydrolipoyl dehydrogenase family protein n=1 Tax=Halobacillus yeomjeoni TaxID=311194 RepID=UPI001CD811C8|nr:NAD(P)/FAD-dependent oxidoreductase [Halobacillus yeomjeoni]MCA0983405.1 NAD(P)/FAD-dependent oxidoreductase [Halobacillus yeomjeoni]
MKRYDLIVIGSGSAGSVAAAKCEKAGWSVAMIDHRPFGGTCALRGCDPKKVLVGAAELIDWNNRMEGKGINSKSSIQWKDLMQFKRTFTEGIPEEKESSLNEQGIDTYHGKAFFTGENSINVEGEDLVGSKILIATGAKPAPLPIEGSEHLTYSDDFLELEELPNRIVFVGGGYISFEFAHIAARAGSEVHIIQRGSQPLKNFDPDLVEMLVEKSKEIGIHIHLNHELKSLDNENSVFHLHAEHKGEMVSFETDLVVHGAGRVPALDMDLEKAGIEANEKGIVVNDYLQSISNPHIYAAGDAAATEGPPLTPVASTESHIVASNMLKGNKKRLEFQETPSVVFTVPKLASVGMNENEIDQSGRKVSVDFTETRDWFTYRRTNEQTAAYKILIDEELDQIVGAHLISNEADELINHFATAIRFNIPIKELKKTLFAYPTAASDIGHML